MMTVTKREAVQALIRGTMRACSEGDEVCALTLAGAAEEAMPPAPPGTTAFGLFRVIHAVRYGLTEAQAGTALNRERNWLKHYNTGEPEPVAITGALDMLVRAISKYEAVYGDRELVPEVSRFFDDLVQAGSIEE